MPTIQNELKAIRSKLTTKQDSDLRSAAKKVHVKPLSLIWLLGPSTSVMEYENIPRCVINDGLVEIGNKDFGYNSFKFSAKARGIIEQTIRDE